MTNLTQQLEDKKKGCNDEYNYTGENCGKMHFDGKIHYCKTCRTQIAILEQAIAEIKILEEELKRMNFKYGNLANKYAELQSQQNKAEDNCGTRKLRLEPWESSAYPHSADTHIQNEINKDYALEGFSEQESRK